jgi:hypothetical protein
LFIGVNLLILENFSSYLDYYLFIPKVIIIIADKSKLINIKTILNIGVKVNIISLNIAIRFKISIIYNIGIAL